jgi:hypothetical protein
MLVPTMRSVPQVEVESDPSHYPPPSLRDWVPVRLNYVDADTGSLLLRSAAIYVPSYLSTEVLERVINDASATTRVPADCELQPPPLI